MSTTLYSEALADATDAIFCIYEDCARRMLGSAKPQLFCSPEPESIFDQVRGDPNKPTPPELLSEQTQILLSSPLLEPKSRESVIQSGLAVLLQEVPVEARVLSLVRGVKLPTSKKLLELEWPDPLSPAQRAAHPHQVLRWIQGEESLSQLVHGALLSPVSQWISGQI